MKYINIKKVVPGSLVGKDIIDENGIVLLKKDIKLTNGIISSLSKKKIEYLYIDDEETKNIVIEEVIPQCLKNSTIRNLKELSIDKTIDNAKKVVDNILEFQNLSVDVYSVSNDENALHEHALAVTQVAILFGKSHGLLQDDLNKLAIASLLHDVGKICQEKNEYFKKYNFESIFSIFETYIPNTYDDKFHPLYGYAILKNNTTIDSVVKNSILRHHENYDNTGIKYRKSDSDDNSISTQFSKIINISDAFIRLMTNTYPGISISNITEVIEFLTVYSGTKFDPSYVEKFLNKVPILPKGLTVDLSNGMQAVIAEVNKKMPTRPKVIINGRLIDLADPRLQSIIISNITGTNEPIKSNLIK